MPQHQDFPWIQYADGTLTVGLQPPTAIGGWNIQFQFQRRFEPGNNSGIFIRSAASGYGGSGSVSGIAVTNSGQGIFTVQIRSRDTSGLDLGNYSYTVTRMDSGFRTPLVEGYGVLQP